MPEILQCCLYDVLPPANESKISDNIDGLNFLSLQ